MDRATVIEQLEIVARDFEEEYHACPVSIYEAIRFLKADEEAIRLLKGGEK